MQFLENFFQQEKKNLLFFSQKNAKNRKFLTMAMNLANITELKIRAVLREYFNMCKTVFMIRSAVAYTWDQGCGSHEAVQHLYHEDAKFARMVQLLHHAIFNLFQGTDRDWKVLGSQNTNNEFKDVTANAV